MKYELPPGHGLSEDLQQGFVFLEGGRPSLTDVQYEALAAGVASGESMLVVSPTSTGKTQIALWAIAQSLSKRYNTVYLVTHRALARQKFEDFKSLLLEKFLASDFSSCVIATGDYVEDGGGSIPPAPLQSPLLVATYEKYLALLSASGVPADMRRTVVVCDEMQLIGDKHRGQSVEVLMTLLRNAGWMQFVGLSAVLEHRDAADLANWLNIRLLLHTNREKNLRYECWSSDGIKSVSSARPDEITHDPALPKGVQLRPEALLEHLLSLRSPPLPIIVFCMKKQDTYDLAEALVRTIEAKNQPQLSLAFDELPETNANVLLARSIEHRIATHNADLTEEERGIVETYLAQGRLDVVFATTTLAAGVNFPLGAALFADWSRWDGDRRTYVPIPTAEFHNMAGRVGRMGFEHVEGRAIFFAKNRAEMQQASEYLNHSVSVRLEPRIEPARFSQLTLQLVASGICSTEAQVHQLISSTYSALRAQDRNPKAFATWGGLIDAGITDLVDDELLWKTKAGKLVASPLGKAIGYSGLLPETGVFLLNYVESKCDVLSNLLPTRSDGSSLPHLAFLLFSACFASPEFRGGANTERTRFIPFPLDCNPLVNPSSFANDLAEPAWRADVMPINASKLALDWINGESLRGLEQSVKRLSAGMLSEMFRNLLWVLQGLAAVLNAVATTPDESGIDKEVAAKLGKLPRVIRRLSRRVAEGLPDDVLWLRELASFPGGFRLGRHEILSLRGENMYTPEQLALGSAQADAARNRVFAKARPSAQAKSNWARDACRQWKVTQRRKACEYHERRARRCASVKLVTEYYATKGTEFEHVFERILTLLDVPFKKLDDGSKTGAPDYALLIPECEPLVVELKSRDGDNLIDYNRAVEVIAAAEVHNYKGAFCVTLCHPGVDPSVPLVIAECGRLCVVESHDLGEALLRICEKSLTALQLWQWLATPGQALANDLPWKEYPATP